MSGINYSLAGNTQPTANVTLTYETPAESLFGRLKTVTDETGTHTLGYVPINPADTETGGQCAKIDKKIGIGVSSEGR